MAAVSLVEEIKNVLLGFSYSSILKVLIIALLGFIAYRFAIKGIKAIFEKNSLQPRAQLIILRVFKVIFISALVLIIISELGIDTSSLLVLLAIVLLIFVFAAEDIIGNVASGLVMASSNPFKKGDVVVIDNIEGIVVDIRINCTKIHCYEGETVTIPNKMIATSKVINYSTDQQRRALVKFVASYKSNPHKVINVCTEMLKDAEGILHTIEPRVFVSEYGDSNIEYSIYFWTKPDERLLRKLQITTMIYDVFQKEGIEISYPQIRLSEENKFGANDD